MPSEDKAFGIKQLRGELLQSVRWKRTRKASAALPRRTPESRGHHSAPALSRQRRCSLCLLCLLPGRSPLSFASWEMLHRDAEHQGQSLVEAEPGRGTAQAAAHGGSSTCPPHSTCTPAPAPPSCWPSWRSAAARTHWTCKETPRPPWAAVQKLLQGSDTF